MGSVKPPFNDQAPDAAPRPSQLYRAALLNCMDVISQLDDPRDIMAAASETVGRALGADRAGYSEVSDDRQRMQFRVCWSDGGLEPLTGEIALASAGEHALTALGNGQVLVIKDGAPGGPITPPAWRSMGARASISAPLMRDGLYVASFWVHQARPRDWAAEEITLVRDVAARTWDAFKRAQAEEELKRLNASLQAQVEAQTRQLREREAQWRGLFDQMQEGLFLATILRDDRGRPYDWRYLEINPAWEKLVDIPREAAIGRTSYEVFKGAIDDELMALLLDVAEDGEPRSFTRKVGHRDCWYEGHAFRVDEERLAVLLVDTTQRKLADDALAASEATLSEERGRLATLVDHLPVGVAFVDPKGSILLSNPAYDRFDPSRVMPSARPDGETRWLGWDATGAPLTRDQFIGPRALGGETVPGVEFLVRLDDGSTVWTRVSGVPVRDAEGAVRAALVVVDEIDDQKRAKEALEQLNQTLEERVMQRTAELESAQEALRQAQKMEALGHLTGGIAHDFNNLLAGISGSLELLGSRIAQGRIDAAPRYIEAAQGAARRAAALTHRLLAFSRRQTLTPRSITVDALIRDIEDLIRRSIGPQIEVRVIETDGLWPTLIDANQLENALLNLCINARDAMPDGGHLVVQTANHSLGEADAAKRDMPAGDYVLLSVTDTGTGMTPDVIARAFDPFFTTKPIGQGTGLGLSMIYGFVRQSGGYVDICSEVGLGTTVNLYLPRHDGVADRVAARGAASMAALRAHGETVLVVDDEPGVRLLIAEVLRDVGYSVIQAVDGVSAMKILESPAHIDLLISDVGLPGGLNGRQVADAARAIRPGLKVLLVTGYAEASALGADPLGQGIEVLTKPFEIDVLAGRVYAIIERQDHAERDDSSGV